MGIPKGSYNCKMLPGISHNKRELALVVVLFRPCHSNVSSETQGQLVWCKGFSLAKTYYNRLHPTSCPWVPGDAQNGEYEKLNWPSTLQNGRPLFLRYAIIAA